MPTIMTAEQHRREAARTGLFVFSKPPEGKIRVASTSWEDDKTIMADEVLRGAHAPQADPHPAAPEVDRPMLGVTCNRLRGSL